MWIGAKERKIMKKLRCSRWTHRFFLTDAVVGDAIELHRLFVDRGNIIEGIHYFGDGVKDQLVAHTLSGALFCLE
jgi:hypothetical protein